MNLPRLLGIAAMIASIVVVAWILFSTSADEPTLTPSSNDVAAVDEVEPTLEAPALEEETSAREEVVVAPVPTVETLPEAYPPHLFGPDKHRLHGIVIDAVSGEPIPFLAVTLAPVDAGDIKYLARNRMHTELFRNSKGGFVRHGLDAGMYNLHIASQGYRDLILNRIDIPSPTGSLELKMSRGAYIEVSVVDQERDGIGGVEVQLVAVRLDESTSEPEPIPANIPLPLPYTKRSAPAAPHAQLARTDDYGKVIFSNIPTGVYRVQLVNDAMGAEPTPEFYLGAGSNYPCEFVIRTLNRLTVRARDPDGHALGGVQVRLWATGGGLGTYRVETGSDGEGYAEFVTAGPYTLKVWKPGFLRLIRDIQVADLGEHLEEIILQPDPTDGEAERNATPEQLERLKRGESAADVFGKRG